MRAALPRPSSPATRASLRRTALCVALLVPLAGCGNTDRINTSSIPSDDYRVRHPILLAKDTTTLDIFPAGHDGLDRHSAKQLMALAQDYRQAGQGPILVLLPVGSGQAAGPNVAAGIRRVFAASGVTAGIDVATYPVANPALASPIRVSFTGLKAKVGDQCGQWPSDLSSGSSIDGWQNKEYYNLGCATQSMIAAQTADPRDLVTPRGEEPADTQIRSRAIESVRKGTDPATAWTVHNSSIGSVGGS